MLRSAAPIFARRAALLAASLALVCAKAPALFAEDAAPADAPAAAAPKAEAPAQLSPPPYPEAPLANTGWALEFTQKAPRAMGFKTEDGGIQWYWFMTFHIENREDEAHLLIPTVEVVTDSGKIHNGNAKIPQEVYEAIYKRCGNAMVEPVLKIAGEIKPGKDFARDGIIIWPQSKDDVDTFTVYVSGIYGQTAPVNDPATGKPLMVPAKNLLSGETKKDADGNPLMQPAELKRTLRLTYTCPGTHLGKDDAKLVATEDVMR